MESYKTQVRALREALKAGEASGALAPFDSMAFLTRMRMTHAAQNKCRTPAITPNCPAPAAGVVPPPPELTE